MHDAQKIAVLDRALELLGSKGEHWVQGYYFANKSGGGGIGRADPRYANAWCLAGACNQAAFELGVSDLRAGFRADEVVVELSLNQFTLDTHDCQVADYNDDPNTSFLKIRRLVRNYMLAVKGEQT